MNSCENCKSDNKYSFTKSEFWLLFLFIVTLIGAISYIAHDQAGNGSALNYVSFTSTIVSIILALIAIGYTYGESIKERQSSESLANQISILSTLSGRLQEHSEGLASIKEIDKKVTHIRDNINHKDLDISTSFNNDIPLENKYSSLDTITDILIEKADQGYHISLTAFFLLEYVSLNGMTNKSTLLSDLRDRLLEESDTLSEVDSYFIIGAFSQLFDVFSKLGLIRVDSNLNFIFEKDLTNALRSITQSIKARTIQDINQEAYDDSILKPIIENFYTE